MSARGNYNKGKNKNKLTLKNITTEITGYTEEEDYVFDALYQEIKRIRKLIKDAIPSIGLGDLKTDTENKIMLIEWVFKNKKYKDILNKMKKKEKLTNEELVELSLLLSYTNLYKHIKDDSDEYRETFKFALYLGQLDSTMNGIRNNLVELFLLNPEVAIKYANDYLSEIDKSFKGLRQGTFITLLQEKKKSMSENEELQQKENQLLKEIEEEYIYVDCEGKAIDKIDRSKYDNFENVIFYNTGQMEILKEHNKNKKD